jgi:hypothetical protein
MMDVNPENPLGWWSFKLLMLTCCLVLCVTCMQRGGLLGGVGPATRKRNVFSDDSYTLKADFLSYNVRAGLCVIGRFSCSCRFGPKRSERKCKCEGAGDRNRCASFSLVFTL